MTVANPRDVPSVLVDQVCKTYQLGELSGLQRTLTGLLRRVRVRSTDSFAALHDITFEALGGTVVGLVGPNGSGKSTLLHAICGITLPTSGSITVHGRVLPLFAIGTSFHRELTGRENIVLFGAVLGLRPSVIEPQAESIAAFAELEAHLDTPVKRYSEGMKARLSFAIAMRFPADIYIFDEVLAVVDSSFRDRCLTEIETLRETGKLVFFVSHEIGQVQRICTNTLWLEQGRVRAFGPSDEILPQYEQDRAEHSFRLLAAEGAPA